MQFGLIALECICTYVFTYSTSFSATPLSCLIRIVFPVICINKLHFNKVFSQRHWIKLKRQIEKNECQCIYCIHWSCTYEQASEKEEKEHNKLRWAREEWYATAGEQSYGMKRETKTAIRARESSKIEENLIENSSRCIWKGSTELDCVRISTHHLKSMHIALIRYVLDYRSPYTPKK